MANQKRKLLWVSEGKRRYFLIPETIRLLKGPLRLHALGQPSCQADPKALRRYEISEEQARTHLQEEWSSLAQQIGQWLTEMFQELQPPSPEQPDQLARWMEQPDADRVAELATLLSLSPETMQAKVEELQEGMRFLLEGVPQAASGLFEDEAEADPQQNPYLHLFVLKSGQSAAALRKVDWPALPAEIQRWYSDALEREEVEKWVGFFKEVAEQLEQLSTALEDPDADLYAFLEQWFDPTPSAEEQEARLASYRQAARDSVARATKDFKLPTFDIDEMWGAPSDESDR